jgi:hypothetical protein
LISGYYTKGEVDTFLSNLIDSAPAALNTLKELAAALANDANYATTVQNQLATKANIVDVEGQLVLNANQSTTYTQTETDNLLTLKATTAYVDAQLLLNANTADMTAALALKAEKQQHTQYHK